MFTGEIDISFFEDKEMTKHIQQAPYQYMSDLEFFFNASDNKSVFTSAFVVTSSCDTASINIARTAHSYSDGRLCDGRYEFL